MANVVWVACPPSLLRSLNHVIAELPRLKINVMVILHAYKQHKRPGYVAVSVKMFAILRSLQR